MLHGTSMYRAHFGTFHPHTALGSENAWKTFKEFISTELNTLKLETLSMKEEENLSDKPLNSYGNQLVEALQKIDEKLALHTRYR